MRRRNLILTLKEEEVHREDYMPMEHFSASKRKRKRQRR
jgi:hypothetical protein